eukprot:1878699-Rhodomonas_salina.1
MRTSAPRAASAGPRRAGQPEPEPEGALLPARLRGSLSLTDEPEAESGCRGVRFIVTVTGAGGRGSESRGHGQFGTQPE